MKKKYTIEVDIGQQFPFLIQNQKQSIFQYKLRITLPLKPPFTFKHYQQKIQYITEIEKQSKNMFVKLQQVNECRLSNCVLLTYECLPYSLKTLSNSRIKVDAIKIEKQIYSISQKLIQKKILPEISMKFFVFDNKMDVKYLLLPNFKQMNKDNVQIISFQSELSSSINNFINQTFYYSNINYKVHNEDEICSQKLSQKDYNAYNKKFQQRIAFYENKLLNCKNKGTNQILIHHKFKKPKKFSSNFTQQCISISSSSSNSNNQKSQENEKKRNRFASTKSQEIFKLQQKKPTQKQLEWIYQIQNIKLDSKKQQKISKQSSNTQIEDPEKKNSVRNNKLANSLIIEEKNQYSKIKHHKSSFGDYSNYATQNQKSVKLKTRVSFAIQKSQHALDIIQKYQKKFIKKS